MSGIQRRSFLKGSVVAALAATQSRGQGAASAGGEAGGEAASKVVLSEPVLQIPGSDSMGVAWAVNTLSTGFVEIGTTPDMKESRVVNAGDGGLKALCDKVLSVRLTGLKPNTRYYYRTGTQPIDFKAAYKIEPGAVVLGKTYSFTTAGEGAASTFAVINDTHENQKAIARLMGKVEELKSAVTLWNGDACNHINDDAHMQRIFLNPGGEDKFATSRPCLFVPGNHDYRGRGARGLPRFLLHREPSERDSKYWTLGHNFAVRQGEIAMIGLDTGEDKPDFRDEWGNLAQFTEYRKLQTEWLADVMESRDVRSAPYVVAFCHIPLFDSNPKANPGDLAEHFASWQRPCSNMWSPIFERHRVQLVVAAHTHRYRYDAPSGDRSWAQIVNGAGNTLKEGSHLALLDGRVEGGKLRVRVHNVLSDEVFKEHLFDPRG